jgi:hypothetical protein
MLVRIAILLLVLGPIHPAAAGPKCTDEAKANTARDRATKAAEARLARALVTRKLRPVGLERISLGPRDIYAPVNFKPDQVTTAKHGAATVDAITGLVGSCAGGAPEFAQRGTKVFRIERKPTAGKTTTVTICGCPHPHFTCGGARMTVEPVGYVLPAGTTFGGVLDVEYVADSVSIVAEHPCAPVAPPP